LARRRTKRALYRGAGLPRRRRTNWRRVVRLALGAVTLCGLAVGIYFALTTPRLIVRKVRVVGANGALAARITHRVTPECAGKNIFRIKKRYVVKLSLQEPEVARAWVHRGLPRTIVVKVKLRQPYAILCAGDAACLMDKDGIPFRKCSSAHRLGLPQIKVSRPMPIELGRPCRGAAKSALRCIWAAADYGFKVRKISVDPAGDLCLNVVNRFYVKMGPPTNLDGKLEILGKMLEGKPEMFNHIEYVDLSCPTAPAVKRKPT